MNRYKRYNELNNYKWYNFNSYYIFIYHTRFSRISFLNPYVYYLRLIQYIKRII